MRIRNAMIALSLAATSLGALALPLPSENSGSTSVEHKTRMPGAALTKLPHTAEYMSLIWFLGGFSVLGAIASRLLAPKADEA